MTNFNGSKFFAKRKFWAVAGQVYLYDDKSNLICYVRQKILKLKEDITVFNDEKMTEPILNIKARQIVDFSAAYDVTDVLTGEKAGALKRKGWKSLLKDKWILLDENDNEIGTLGEESSAGALASRMINLIPQKYVMQTNDGTVIARFDQQFAIAVHKFDIEFFDSGKPLIDRRLAMGALLLLLLIEGKQ